MPPFATIAGLAHSPLQTNPLTPQLTCAVPIFPALSSQRRCRGAASTVTRTYSSERSTSALLPLCRFCADKPRRQIHLDLLARTCAATQEGEERPARAAAFARCAGAASSSLAGTQTRQLYSPSVRVRPHPNLRGRWRRLRETCLSTCPRRHGTAIVDT